MSSNYDIGGFAASATMATIQDAARKVPMEGRGKFWVGFFNAVLGFAEADIGEAKAAAAINEIAASAKGGTQ